MGSHPAPCHGCLLLTACASYGLAPYARSRVPLPAACAGYGIAPYAWSRVQALPAARAGHKLAPRALFACPARCALTPHLSTATKLSALAERSRRHQAESREEQLRTLLRLPQTAPPRCSSPAASLATPAPLGLQMAASSWLWLAALPRYAKPWPAATRPSSARRRTARFATSRHRAPSSWACSPRPPRRRSDSSPATTWRPLRLTCHRSDRFGLPAADPLARDTVTASLAAAQPHLLHRASALAATGLVASDGFAASPQFTTALGSLPRLVEPPQPAWLVASARSTAAAPRTRRAARPRLPP